ncbi:MAG: phosphonate metabolism transcriptional regulator PhnF [Rubrimonas sp.]|uniref:phosphonate metabolism transcriptional regulator PhnF n=1 Tax=Rubrimonas sp. TaxID=2036015 RepID=UPI002FDE6A03
MANSPIWREIYGALRRDIGEGRFRTGDKLPTEKELSERFDVNRHTVRRALAELTTEGAIWVRRGSGAYVAEGVVDYRIGPKVKFSQNVRELGRAPAHKLLRAEIVPADEPTQRHLGLRVGEQAIELETLGFADDLPVHNCRHIFPAARFPGLIKAFEACGSITEALKNYGVIDYRRSWTRITARAPSRVVAARLRQSETQPVLRVEALNLDMAGQPIEYAVSFWAGARAQFVVEPE